jgi:hypothetical protein
VSPIVFRQPRPAAAAAAVAAATAASKSRARGVPPIRDFSLRDSSSLSLSQPSAEGEGEEVAEGPLAFGTFIGEHLGAEAETSLDSGLMPFMAKQPAASALSREAKRSDTVSSETTLGVSAWQY